MILTVRKPFNKSIKRNVGYIKDEATKPDPDDRSIIRKEPPEFLPEGAVDDQNGIDSRL